MVSPQDKLLNDFESFECDLEVEQSLKKVKTDCVPDQGVTPFGEQLQQRDREKRAAQAAREAQVEQQWSPGCYPQLTTAWFIEGLDYCCDYWRFQFKRPLTPLPAPPSSPRSMSFIEEEEEEDFATPEAMVTRHGANETWTLLNLDSGDIIPIFQPVWDQASGWWWDKEVTEWLDGLIAALEDPSSLENTLDLTDLLKDMTPKEWEHVMEDVLDTLV